MKVYRRHYKSRSKGENKVNAVDCNRVVKSVDSKMHIYDETNIFMILSKNLYLQLEAQHFVLLEGISHPILRLHTL